MIDSFDSLRAVLVVAYVQRLLSLYIMPLCVYIVFKLHFSKCTQILEAGSLMQRHTAEAPLTIRFFSALLILEQKETEMRCMLYYVGPTIKLQ